MKKLSNVSTDRLLASTVIITADIESEERKIAFDHFVRTELNGAERSEGTYDFLFADCSYIWTDFFKKIKEIIDVKEDIVYVWDMTQPRGELKRQLFRTRVG